MFRLGALTVAAGCAWIWPPLGVIVAGVMLCLSVLARVTAKAIKDVADEGAFTAEALRARPGLSKTAEIIVPPEPEQAEAGK